jgi:hypothetical protein
MDFHLQDPNFLKLVFCAELELELCKYRCGNKYYQSVSNSRFISGLPGVFLIFIYFKNFIFFISSIYKKLKINTAVGNNGLMDNN